MPSINPISPRSSLGQDTASASVRAPKGRPSSSKAAQRAQTAADPYSDGVELTPEQLDEMNRQTRRLNHFKLKTIDPTSPKKLSGWIGMFYGALMGMPKIANEPRGMLDGHPKPDALASAANPLSLEFTRTTGRPAPLNATKRVRERSLGDISIRNESKKTVAYVGNDVPTRLDLAERVLRERGLDPMKRYDVEDRYPIGETPGEALHEYSMPLGEIYLEHGKWKMPFIRRHVLNAPMLDELPDLDDLFEKEFSGFKEAQAKRLRSIIEDRLQEGGFKMETPDIAISAAKILRSRTFLFPPPTRDTGRFGYILDIDAEGGRKSIAVSLSHGELATEDITGANTQIWLFANRARFFGAENLKGPFVKENIERGLRLDAAVARIAENLAEATVEPQRKAAYGKTDIEQHVDDMRWSYASAPLAFLPLPIPNLKGASSVLRVVKNGRPRRIYRIFAPARSVEPLSAGASRALSQKAANLAKQLMANPNSPVAKELTKGGVCWDAVINFQLKIGAISKKEALALHSLTRSSRYGRFLQGAKAVADPAQLKKIPAGRRVAFISEADSKMTHAMITAGDSKAIGVNNGFLNPSFSPGWQEIDLAKDISWKGGRAFTSDGRTALHVFVEGL